jgi:peptidoglycan/xylan/chitin deacetylase (PgdA/CDA1 family)
VPRSRRRFLQLIGSVSAAAAASALSIPRALAQQAPAPFYCEVRTYHEVRYPLFKQDLLALLDRGLQPISIETLVGALNGAISLPSGLRTFHITWDDARLSQYTHGWPAIQDVQQARGVFIPVTAFLITKFDHLPIAIMADVPDNTPCYREDGNLPTNHRFMTKAQAIDLIRKGVHAGNHTVDHADLPTLSQGDLEGQIASAEQRIQGLWDLAGVSRPVKVFAYPYGHFNASAIQALQALGYDAAFSTIANAWHSAQERWTLGRFGAPE